MFSSVTVTGPPASICFLNIGTTEPLLPNTLPNLTAANIVLLFLAKYSIIISHILLLAPITEVGFTALSVDININFFVLYLSEALATL